MRQRGRDILNIICTLVTWAILSLVHTTFLVVWAIIDAEAVWWLRDWGIATDEWPVSWLRMLFCLPTLVLVVLLIYEDLMIRWIRMGNKIEEEKKCKLP